MCWLPPTDRTCLHLPASVINITALISVVRIGIGKPSVTNLSAMVLIIYKDTMIHLWRVSAASLTWLDVDKHLSLSKAPPGE